MVGQVSFDTPRLRCTLLRAGDLDAFHSLVVDAVNVASVRVLERLGFVRETIGEGVFGELWTYRLVFRC